MPIRTTIPYRRWIHCPIHPRTRRTTMKRKNGKIRRLCRCLRCYRFLQGYHRLHSLAAPRVVEPAIR